MSFSNRIEIYDAERGIPRRADEPYLPAFHAFLRCMQDLGQIAVFILAGLLSALFLWLAADYFNVGFYARLIYIASMWMAILVALAEAGKVFLPYYQFNQLLTYGTAHWASPLYLEGANFARPINEPLAKGELPLGRLPRPLRPPYLFAVTQDVALGSLVFFGPPRSGKSVLLMNYLRRLAASDWSAVIIDPKGELFEYCARFFRKVYRLDFENSQYSDRWNFILACKGNKEYAHMMASIILGLEGTKYTGTDPFWQEAELALLTAILLYLPTIVDRPTPAMIHEFIALRTFDELCRELGTTDIHEVQVQWGTFTKAPEQTRGSVFTGLAAKINPFTIDAAKAITASILVSEYKRGARYIDFEELREPGVGIFVIIPEGAASRYKIPLATFIGQAVEHLRAGVVDDNTTPVMFVVDEAAHVPIVNLKEIPGVGRGRKFGVMLFYQNLSQGYDMYGEHGFNAILGSINTKTFLPGCDLVTARYASELVGQTTVWGHTFDDAPGTQYDKTRTTEAVRPLMDPAEIRQLPVHRQAITIIETMPPVKWTYPKSVKVGPRSLPRKYGVPRIVNFLDAERETTERRLSGVSGQQTSLSGETAPVKPETNHVRTRAPKVDPETEQIIKQKTREAIGHMLDIFGGASSPLPSSSGSGATNLARVLNQ
ncbi:MAG: type IV secretory system conjugative DNA transfer family protein [Acidobacteriota bacterium]|nr:type IV secretory system conjugative DNA transfer family protein [Acidobacteriota bacterium]